MCHLLHCALCDILTQLMGCPHLTYGLHPLDGPTVISVHPAPGIVYLKKTNSLQHLGISVEVSLCTTSTKMPLPLPTLTDDSIGKDFPPKNFGCSVTKFINMQPLIKLWMINYTGYCALGHGGESSLLDQGGLCSAQKVMFLSLEHPTVWVCWICQYYTARLLQLNIWKLI